MENNIITGLPKGTSILEQNGVQFVSFEKETVTGEGIKNIQIKDMDTYMGVGRYSIFWTQPFFKDEAVDDKDKNYHYLLIRHNTGKYTVILATIAESIQSLLVETDNGFSLQFSAIDKDKIKDKTELLCFATGDNPYELSEKVVAAYANKAGTFKMRKDKSVPTFVDLLGWCTWNAWFHDVSEKLVLDGLDILKEKNIPVKFMILDDGWQDTQVSGNRNRFLNSFNVNDKFPSGLAKLAETAKNKYEIDLFAIWGTFQGYWNGLLKTGELSNKYNIINNTYSDHKGEHITEMVHPDDIERFYDDWFAYLADQGVDMVKIDNQSRLSDFAKGKVPIIDSVKKYREALETSTNKYFKGNLINCMSMAIENSYHMNSSLVQRNTEDYFSWKGSEKFWQKHVMMNAYNNIFTAQYALPDWDMFDSKHPDAEFQAAARAISGGPIYFADKPENADAELIGKLAYSDGKVLRCSQPAQVTEDNLFINPNKEAKLLKIFNQNNEIGILGLFHCLYDEDKKVDAITGKYSSSDVYGLTGEKFAIYYQTSGKVEVLEKHESKNISLDYMKHELLTISPIKNGIAPFGLLDKLNGSKAVNSFTIKDDVAEMEIEQGGMIGVYCESKPKNVTVNNKKIDFVYNENNLLIIKDLCSSSSARVGKTVQIRLN